MQRPSGRDALPRHLQRLRREIETGAYDEDAALEAALDKLARDLGVTLDRDPPRRDKRADAA